MFACSYSIAGLNVLSGNPADHLVHRHTHRVVRGSLLVCGRPDGRLSALSTAEASVCLSVNQASSIQSWGGTCESITIGHNPVKLPLTKKGIFLKRKRPLFLCERMLVEVDVQEERDSIKWGDDSSHRPPLSDMESKSLVGDSNGSRRRSGALSKSSTFAKERVFRRRGVKGFRDASRQSSLMPVLTRKRSAAALIGAYTNFEEETTREFAKQRVDFENEKTPNEEAMTVEAILAEAVERKKFSDEAKRLFGAVDKDNDGSISLEEMLDSPFRKDSDLSDEQVQAFFETADADNSGSLDYREFLELLKLFQGELPKIPLANRNEMGLIRIEQSRERYFGETVRKYNSGMENVDFWLARRQELAQELYETRIASMQRFVAMTVMFHQMGKRVQEFFRKISFGFWGYRMDRTHSIMRIATTASPISGADVKQRIRRIQLSRKIQRSIRVIETAYSEYRKRRAGVLSSDETKQVGVSGNGMRRKSDPKNHEDGEEYQIRRKAVGVNNSGLVSNKTSATSTETQHGQALRVSLMTATGEKTDTPSFALAAAPLRKASKLDREYYWR